ncbi:MAG: aldo/keto reductase [Armatimonadetes bacterium]|nr:aldo/keto reductase [Armatimonadota bacterium]
MLQRPLGKTGHSDAVVAFGGIVVSGETQERANQIVAKAIAVGVNHFDVAPTYGDAEVKLGEALRPYRQQVFLACKTAKRTYREAAEELRRSLERLQTDYFDLYQFHGLDSPEDMETVFGPDGALKAFVEAREKGLIRHIGMTTHRPENLLEALRRFPIETAMFPINFAIFMRTDYGKGVIDALVEQGVGVIAIKPIAARRWQEGEERRWPKCWYKPLDDAHQIDLAVRWALGLPITTLVPSGHAELFEMAVKSALAYRPLSVEETQELEQLAQTLTPVFP